MQLIKFTSILNFAFILMGQYDIGSSFTSCTVSLCEFDCQHGMHDHISLFMQNFIAQNKLQCALYKLIMGLQVTYPNDQFNRNWFSGNFSLSQLEITFPKYVQTDVFEATPFQTVKILHITIGSNISISGTFNGLNSLKNLNILATVQHIFPENTLSYLANLESLSFRNEQYSKIQQLHGLTDGSSLLKLKYLNIKASLRNTLTNDNILSALIAISHFDLSNCDITTLSADVFKPMAKTIKYLNLANNKLVMLEPIAFSDLLKNSVTVEIQKNLWYCDCNLCNSKLTLLDYSISKQISSCLTTHQNSNNTTVTNGLCLSNSCSSNYPRTTEISSTNEKTPQNSPTQIPFTTTNENRNLLRIECPKYNTSQRGIVLELKPQDTFFKIENHSNGIVDLQFDTPSMLYKRYWLNNEKNILCRFRKESIYFSIDSLLARHSYTFCATKHTQARLSPLNCLSYRNEQFYKSRAWMYNSNKALVYSLIGLGVCLSILLGSIIGYGCFLLYPTLLRGSSNVVIVNKMVRNNMKHKYIEDRGKFYLEILRDHAHERSFRLNTSYESNESLSRFEIVKRQLENDIFNKENQYYLENSPYVYAPSPPKIKSIMKRSMPFNDEENCENFYFSISDERKDTAC